MMKRIGKDRITITMRRDLLAALDQFIDGDSIRNRSHAIEYIVGRYLGAGITTCVILAGGKAEQTMKTMLRIHNRPIIAYMIEQLRQANIRNIIVIINGACQDMKLFLGNGSQWKVNLSFVEEAEACGTAHSLNLVRDKITSTFLLTYGDILAEIDMQELVRFHREREGLIATLAVTACTNPSLYGVTELQGNRVYRLIEKPPSYDKTNLVFSGIAVCEPSIFEYLDNKCDRYLARDILPDLAHRGQIGGYPFVGKWFDVSHDSEYARAKQLWLGPSF